MSREFPWDQAAGEVDAEYRPGPRKRGLRGRPGLTAALVVLVLAWAFFGHFTLTLRRAELTGAQDEAKGAVQAAAVFFSKTLNQAGLVLDALVEDFWEHGTNPSLHMAAMSERMLKRVPAALGVVLVDTGGRVLFSHPKPVAPDLSLHGPPDFSELLATTPGRLAVSSVGFCPIYQVPAFSVAQTMRNDEGDVVAAAKVVFSARRLAERMSPLLPHLGDRLAVLDGRGRILTLAPYDETRLRDPSLADAAHALPIGMERRTPGLSPPGSGKSDDFVAVGYKPAADGPALFVFADLAVRLAEPRLAVYGYGLLGAASSLLVLGAGLLLDRAAGRRERLVRALEKSRAALIRRKRLFKSIIDLAPAAIAWKDASGRILGGNKRFEQFCGAPLSALLGTREHECPVPLAAMDSRLDALAIQGRSVRDVETVLDDRTYSTARAPLYDEAGRVSGLIFAALDVTDRIEAERDLAEALAELQSLFDTALVGVALLHDFSFIKLNEAAACILGYETIELVGKPCQVVHVDALQYNTVHNQFAADFSQGRSTFIEEFPYRRKDGSIVYLRLHARPVDFSLVESPVVVTFEDVSEQRLLRLQAEDAERMIKHDLKGPLSALKAIPDLLLGDVGLSPESREIVEHMRRASGRVLALVDASAEVLDMERGRFRPSPVPASLPALLTESLAEAELRWGYKRLRVEHRIAVEGAPGMVRGKPSLIQSVLDNLTSNAFEAASKESVVAVELDRDGDRVRASVENAGEIPESFRERVFEKFATRGKIKGTGLGAYSARLIARAHGGEVTWEVPSPGRIRFTAEFPAFDGADEQ